MNKRQKYPDRQRHWYTEVRKHTDQSFQWLMIMKNIIRFGCGLPSGKQEYWIMVTILGFWWIFFNSHRQYKMIEYGNFWMIQANWLSTMLSHSKQFLREKFFRKSHDLQKCNSKIDFYHFSWLCRQFMIWDRLPDSISRNSYSRRK